MTPSPNQPFAGPGNVPGGTAFPPGLSAVGLGQSVETRQYLVGPNLRIGSEGTAVLQLQRDLKNLGIDVGPLDGIYGPQTDNAVKTFQGMQNIAVDGIVGPNTREMLAEAMRTQRDVIIEPPATGGANGAQNGTSAQAAGIPWASILAIGGVAVGLTVGAAALRAAD